MPGYMNLACTETLNHEVDNFLTNVETNFTISARESYEILLEDLYVNGKSDAPSIIWLSLEGIGLFDAILPLYDASLVSCAIIILYVQYVKHVFSTEQDSVFINYGNEQSHIKPRQWKSMLIHQGWFTTLYSQHKCSSF